MGQSFTRSHVRQNSYTGNEQHALGLQVNQSKKEEESSATRPQEQKPLEFKLEGPIEKSSRYVSEYRWDVLTYFKAGTCGYNPSMLWDAGLKSLPHLLHFRMPLIILKARHGLVHACVHGNC